MVREYGYVRVSSKDQHEDRQLKAMHDAGIKEEFIYVEKASGKDFNRPEYKQLKRALHEGDTLYIKSLDRFGRNKKDILIEWQWMIDHKIDIVVIDMPILDTRKYKELQGIGTLITDLVLNILSWLAEEERKNIKQRQAEGIITALDKGIKFGRKKIETNDTFIKVYTEWKAGNITAKKAMELLDLKRNTFYRRVDEHEKV